jgi:hypothetical protein
MKLLIYIAVPIIILYIFIGIQYYYSWKLDREIKGECKICGDKEKDSAEIDRLLAVDEDVLIINSHKSKTNESNNHNKRNKRG